MAAVEVILDIVEPIGTRAKRLHRVVGLVAYALRIGHVRTSLYRTVGLACHVERPGLAAVVNVGCSVFRQHVVVDNAYRPACVACFLILLQPTAITAAINNNHTAIYDLSGRHLRPEAIIPYPGRRLSARGVTTIGTTRR